ncbi:MAG: hypothetical protein RIT81_13085 [Deltaproteobacteria bacterium]
MHVVPVKAAMFLTLFVTDPSAVVRHEVDAAIAAASSDRAGLRIITAEERFVLAEDIEAQVRRCGSDVGCVADRVHAVRADWVGLVLIDAPSRLVDVRLIDVAAKKAIASAAARPEGGPGPTVQRFVGEALDAAGHPRNARLEVRVTPTDATLLVEPSEAAPIRAGAPAVLAPGTYRITVTHDDHVSRTTEITLASKEHRTVEVRLDAVPTLVEQPWFWGGVAVVVGAGLVTAFVALDGRATCYCVRRPGVVCPESCP